MGETRFLDLSTGAVRRTLACTTVLGMEDAFILDELLVGIGAEDFHVMVLDSCEVLWRVPEVVSNPLVSDGDCVIRAQEEVTAFDLRTGAVRWNRPKADFGGGAYQMGFISHDLFVVKVGEPLLLTAIEVKTGKTVWRTDFPVQWCQPYGDRAYGIESKGLYRILDIDSGKVVFEEQVRGIATAKGRKRGLTVGPTTGHPWRDARVAVSETHAFIQRPSGQIVVLARDTGDVEQVVELDGMPTGRTEPVIYQNRLLLTDFNASVYCFEGAA